MDYKKILEGIVNIIRTTEKSDIGFANICTYIGESCPELAESEDEKIRKVLIELVKCNEKSGYFMFNNITTSSMLAWLEKQGEQKPAIEMKSAEESLGIDSEIYNKIVDECIYGDVDKVEPKFKVGDFIVNDYCTGKVIELTNDAYLLDTGQGIPFSCEHNAHLWTIQDAKNGDVLASELCGTIMLYKGIEDNNIQFYCDYDFSDIDVPGDRFAINNGQHYGSVDDSDDWHPATKEQRDLLFQKMKEAGYEWDAEKKELKKIEKKSTWNEDDERIYQSIIDDTVQENQLNCEQTNWLRDIKYRYFPQPKQEWSKEDESYLNTTIAYLKNAKEFKKTAENCINWLKSLRPQKNEVLPQWRRLPLNGISYAPDSWRVMDVITSTNGANSASVSALVKGDYYVPLFELEKFIKNV